MKIGDAPRRRNAARRPAAELRSDHPVARLPLARGQISQLVGPVVVRVGGVALGPDPGGFVTAHFLSNSCQRSLFSTGFLSLLFQPFRFQLWIHWVMPFFTYS